MSKSFKYGLLVGLPLGVLAYFAIVWLLPQLGQFTYVLT